MLKFHREVSVDNNFEKYKHLFVTYDIMPNFNDDSNSNDSIKLSAHLSNQTKQFSSVFKPISDHQAELFSSAIKSMNDRNAELLSSTFKSMNDRNTELLSSISSSFSDQIKKELFKRILEEGER